MKKKILRDFPSLKDKLIEFESLTKQLKKKREIKVPPHPTYNKTKDAYHSLVHYTNIIHIKLIHQLQLILVGINSEKKSYRSNI